MAIDNVDFAEVAWLDRRDLFPAHPYEYLNLLGYFEQAAIISTSFAEKYQLEPGDVITLNIEQQALEFVVVGILPYWPTQYPDEMPFFVVNLVYIYDQLPLIPYEVWLKMEDQAPGEAGSSKSVGVARLCDCPRCFFPDGPPAA